MYLNYKNPEYLIHGIPKFKLELHESFQALRPSPDTHMHTSSGKQVPPSLTQPTASFQNCSSLKQGNPLLDLIA